MIVSCLFCTSGGGGRLDRRRCKLQFEANLHLRAAPTNETPPVPHFCKGKILKWVVLEEKGKHCFWENQFYFICEAESPIKFKPSS